MPTATRKKNAASSIVAKIDSELADMKTAAIARWREWAHSIAVGGPSPEPREVLEAAFTIGIADAGPALEADAKVIAEVVRHEQRAARDRAARAAALEPYGGVEGVAKLIEQRRAELVELERLASPWAALAGAYADQHVGRLKRLNPRLYG